MLGIFGLVLSLCQGLPLELPTALHAPWHLSAIGPWIGYGLAMFSFYSLVPYELEWGGAAILNLSLLSSDLWTAMARLVFFGGFSEWSALSFTIAFLFVAAGIAFYSHTGEVKRSGDVDGSEMVPPGPRGHRYKSLITGISHDDDDDYVIANNTNNRSNNNRHSNHRMNYNNPNLFLHHHLHLRLHNYHSRLCLYLLDSCMLNNCDYS